MKAISLEKVELKRLEGTKDKGGAGSEGREEGTDKIGDEKLEFAKFDV